MKPTNQQTNKRSFPQKQTPGDTKSSGGGFKHAQFRANVHDFKCTDSKDSSAGNAYMTNANASYRGTKVSIIPKIFKGKLVISVEMSYKDKTTQIINRGSMEYSLEEVYEAKFSQIKKPHAEQEQPKEEEKESGEDSKESH